MKPEDLNAKLAELPTVAKRPIDRSLTDDDHFYKIFSEQRALGLSGSLLGLGPMPCGFIVALIVLLVGSAGYGVYHHDNSHAVFSTHLGSDGVLAFRVPGEARALSDSYTLYFDQQADVNCDSKLDDAYDQIECGEEEDHGDLPWQSVTVTRTCRHGQKIGPTTITSTSPGPFELESGAKLELLSLSPDGAEHPINVKLGSLVLAPPTAEATELVPPTKVTTAAIVERINAEVAKPRKGETEPSGPSLSAAVDEEGRLRLSSTDGSILFTTAADSPFDFNTTRLDEADEVDCSAPLHIELPFSYDGMPLKSVNVFGVRRGVPRGGDELSSIAVTPEACAPSDGAPSSNCERTKAQLGSVALTRTPSLARTIIAHTSYWQSNLLPFGMHVLGCLLMFCALLMAPLGGLLVIRRCPPWHGYTLILLEALETFGPSAGFALTVIGLAATFEGNAGSDGGAAFSNGMGLAMSSTLLGLGIRITALIDGVILTYLHEMNFDPIDVRIWKKGSN